MQTTRDQHDQIGEPVFRVAKLVLGYPADFDAGNRMLDPNTRARQLAIVALLARR